MVINFLSPTYFFPPGFGKASKMSSAQRLMLALTVFFWLIIAPITNSRLAVAVNNTQHAERKLSIEYPGKHKNL